VRFELPLDLVEKCLVNGHDWSIAGRSLVAGRWWLVPR
jgi:hypothetical protein